MKLLSFFLFTLTFSYTAFGSDIPCDVIGTAKDPNLIKLLQAKPGATTPEEALESYKDQYADAVRCKNKADAKRFKMYVDGLEASIENDKAKKSKEAIQPKTDPSILKKPAEAAAPAVVKKISIDCEDESTKPKTIFKIQGTDKDGAVSAEGPRDQMQVRLEFDNRKPEAGRTIEVIVNGQSNKLSLNPGLGPIGFKPGFAMRMLLKSLGINADLKITCFPLSQKIIPDPALEVIPSKIVNDSGRDQKKVSDDLIHSNKNAADNNSSLSK